MLELVYAALPDEDGFKGGIPESSAECSDGLDDRDCGCGT